MFIEEPTLCPSCSGALTKINDQLFCRNSECPAQISAKIIHFCKILGIKGLGPKTIEKLQLTDILEIYYLDKEILTDAVGEKTAIKLLDEIERSKLAPINLIIEAFSIPLIGSTAAKKLAEKIKTLDDIKLNVCKEVGLGEKATTNMLNWITDEYQELKQFLPFYFTPVTTFTDTGKTVCITGKLKSYKKKADAEEDLRAAGYTLVDSVTKNTSYLVDEENGNSAKRQKADKYNITIITDLKDLLNKEN